MILVNLKRESVIQKNGRFILEHWSLVLKVSEMEEEEMEEEQIIQCDAELEGR